MGQCNKMLEEMSFNALFQKLPVGIEVYDERGQLVDLNRDGREFVRYKPEGYYGNKSFRES